MAKNEKKTFVEYYSSLPKEEQLIVRNKFLSQSGISYPTFYSKLSRKRYNLLEQKALEDITNQKFIWD